MKQRNLIIGGAIFVILLTYVLITQTGNKGFNTLELPQLPVISAEEIETIELSKVGQKIVFEKQAGAWQLTQPFVFPVDANKGTTLERLLGGLRITNLITQRSEAEADFGLTSTTAMHVMITGKEKKQVEFFVGQANDAKTHTYIRLPEKTGVYSLLGDVTQQLNLDAKTWRSLKLYDFSTDTIHKVSISRKGKATLKIVREEVVPDQIVTDSAQSATPTALPSKMVWKEQPKGAVLPDADVNRFLSAFSRLAASEILDDASWTKKTLAVITVSTVDKDHVLELLKTDEQGHFWVRRQQESLIYKISDYQGKNLLSLTERN